MKRPEGMPFFLYRQALNKLNARIDQHLKGSRHTEELRLKPLAEAIRRIY